MITNWSQKLWERCGRLLGSLTRADYPVSVYKLVVGLGNPGKKYAGTRHNVGFEVLERIARRIDASGPRSRFSGLLYEGQYEGTKLLLLAPGTFMNLSGRSVEEAVRYLKLPLENLLVICDDFNLPLGRVRFRPEGSAGGQRGLANIIEQLGTSSVPRLRVGIGPLPSDGNPVDFVLGQFTGAEREVLEPVLEHASRAVLDWVQHGIRYCMDRYNGPRWLEPGHHASGGTGSNNTFSGPRGAISDFFSQE